ncbi:MAG: LuxR C-terminal-related transcriptional regulator [Candidatus Promineifilaceae bacterium]
MLYTKLHAPPLRPNIVPRPNLAAKLNQIPVNKLTLISAPAGFGKTTLVNEWAACSTHEVAWLSLDEDDSDPTRFLTYLIASVQTIREDFGKEILNAFHTQQPPPIKTAVTSLINKVGDFACDIVMVLDDYHLINNEAIHHALTYLLEHQPPRLHLVITTREDPPLPLSRWRARGELIEIREQDLRFNTLETTTLFNEIIQLNLTADQIEILRSKTEGWISGLQLAALSMRGQEDVEHFVHSFAGSNRFILDYLMEEVFQQQSPEVQDFLLKTAVLEQFTAPLCNALIAVGETPGDGSEQLNHGLAHQSTSTTPNSQAILERLEQANLFIIPLDDARQWFRYHHLFADLLRQRLRLAAGDTTALHLQAAAWYDENGLPGKAINHYLEAEAWEQAAALVESHSNELQKRGENTTFLHWMRALPDRVIEAHRGLCLEYAWALALSGEPDKSEHFLQLAEEAFRASPAQNSKVLSAQIHIARTRQDLPLTISLSRRALSLIPEAAYEARSALSLNLGMAYWQSGRILDAERSFSEARVMAQEVQNHHISILALGFLSMAQAARGQLHQAAHLLQTALDWDADFPANALSHLVQSALLYEWNHLEEAGVHLQKAITLAQRIDNRELESSAYRQQALLMQAVGDNSASTAAVALAENAAGENAPRITRARNDAVTVIIALARGDLDIARLRVEGMPTEASASLFYAPLSLTPACLYLAEGDKSTAAIHLAAEYEKAIRSGYRYGQIEIRLLQTQAASNTDEALDFLVEALTLAQINNFVRSFLDKGKSLIPLLRIAASKHLFPDYCRNLLAEFEREFSPSLIYPFPGPAAPSQVETISEREIEVLGLLADGLTYQEIAGAMFISVNTIKSHLKSIYSKLGVHNRREAVAQARALFLLDPGK